MTSRHSPTTAWDTKARPGRLPRASAGAIPRVDLSDEKAEARMKKALDEFGAVVFENAADAGELKRAEMLFWDWIRTTNTGVDPNVSTHARAV